MDMRGEVEIGANREKVWKALNDPDVLRRSIQGCESLEKTGDDAFSAKVRAKIGPVSATFNGDVRITDANPPERYTITGEGKGGAAGFAKGGADVALEELASNLTRLSYDARADVGGKLAQLGSRLIQGSAKKMADDFFTRFKGIVEEDGAPATTAPAIDTDDGPDPAAEAPPAATPEAAPPATSGGGSRAATYDAPDTPPAATDETRSLEGAAATGSPHPPEPAGRNPERDPSATPGGMMGAASTTATDAKALHEANRTVTPPPPPSFPSSSKTPTPTPAGFGGPPWIKWAIIAVVVVVLLALIF